jgi:hypothetical protein
MKNKAHSKPWPPVAIVEIGTFTGATTVRIVKQLPDAVVHTIDLGPNDSIQNEHLTDFHLIKRRDIVGREIAARRSDCPGIFQHYGDSATYDFSLFAPDCFAPPTCFFIDGSHSYFYTRNDSEKSFALCNGHGLFFWHDANAAHPGVLKLLEEWRWLGRDIRLISSTTLAYWNST